MCAQATTQPPTKNTPPNARKPLSESDQHAKYGRTANSVLASLKRAAVRTERLVRSRRIHGSPAQQTAFITAYKKRVETLINALTPAAEQRGEPEVPLQ